MPAPPLIGDYATPLVEIGDRVYCLFRRRYCYITSFTTARIPWPRCACRGQQGGSGLLVGHVLRRAIRTESAAAIMYWFGVGEKAVWNWRKVFAGEGRLKTPGSRTAHRELSRKGARAIKAKVWTDEELDARAELSKRLGLRPPNRWKARGGWTANEVKLLAEFIQRLSRPRSRYVQIAEFEEEFVGRESRGCAERVGT
jgi:hypothetical protein